MHTIVHHQCPQSIVVCACAIALRDLVTETSADAEHLRQALSGVGTVGCLALLHRHEHGIPTHPHGLAVRPVRRRARPGQPRCRTTLPSPASRARAALPGAAAALGRVTCQAPAVSPVVVEEFVFKIDTFRGILEGKEFSHVIRETHVLRDSTLGQSVVWKKEFDQFPSCLARVKCVGSFCLTPIGLL